MKVYEQRLKVVGLVLARLYRRSLYTAAAAVTVALLYVGYFALLPGSWFLESGDVKVSASVAGSEVPFDWCRAPRHGSIKAQATRSFYMRVGTRFEPAQTRDYNFSLTIEPNSEKCPRFRVAAARQPQEQGTYYFRTDLTWDQNGFEKKLQYRSGSYFIASSRESLTKELERSRAETRRLEERLKSLGIPITPSSNVNTLTMPTVVTIKEPTTSAPPDPGTSTPSTPAPAQSSPEEVRPLIDLAPLLFTVDGVVQRLPVVGGLS